MRSLPFAIMLAVAASFAVPALTPATALAQKRVAKKRVAPKRVAKKRPARKPPRKKRVSKKRGKTNPKGIVPGLVYKKKRRKK